VEFRLAYRNIQDPLYFDKNANKVVFIPVVDEGVGFILLFQEMTEEKKAIIEFFPSLTEAFSTRKTQWFAILSKSPSKTPEGSRRAGRKALKTTKTRTSGTSQTAKKARRSRRSCCPKTSNQLKGSSS